MRMRARMTLLHPEDWDITLPGSGESETAGWLPFIPPSIFDVVRLPLCFSDGVALLRGLCILLCVVRGLRVRDARHRVQGHLLLHCHGGQRRSGTLRE